MLPVRGSASGSGTSTYAPCGASIPNWARCRLIGQVPGGLILPGGTPDRAFPACCSRLPCPQRADDSRQCGCGAPPGALRGIRPDGPRESRLAMRGRSSTNPPPTGVAAASITDKNTRRILLQRYTISAAGYSWGRHLAGSTSRQHGLTPQAAHTPSRSAMGWVLRSGVRLYPSGRPIHESTYGSCRQIHSGTRGRGLPLGPSD